MVKVSMVQGVTQDLGFGYLWSDIKQWKMDMTFRSCFRGAFPLENGFLNSWLWCFQSLLIGHELTNNHQTSGFQFGTDCIWLVFGSHDARGLRFLVMYAEVLEPGV
jgi:hypothetical protein